MGNIAREANSLPFDVFYLFRGHGHWVKSLALSTKYALRTGAFDHTGKEYSSSEKMKKLANHVYFSPDGQWLASASFDKSVKLWNAITGEFVAAFRGHVGPVYQISWSADSKHLLSGSKESTLNGFANVQVTHLIIGYSFGQVFAVDWSPDGERVASGGKDRVLKLWMR
ncbi:hypothetical protein COLO4_24393 [Corchorus olitorius]|uniref:Uncharacterized protein n=1 Tax=Corchorus olitorius TaxID=93759 RepID=A0A1R3IAJ8_9ROSI|nr:hypothetical protein COLO4_24393 [Corchorus olitorius]